jgi:hypothetical protein
MTREALINAAIAAALLYLNYASRARALTPAQAEAEWRAVNERAKCAMDNWGEGHAGRRSFD